MSKKIWQLIYFFVVTPLFLSLIHVAAGFSSKIRNALLPRYKIHRELQSWLEKNDPGEKKILFHAASLGEYEHIKPVIRELKSTLHCTNLVTFFSPSGYENSRAEAGLDYRMYMPFDTIHAWSRLYDLIKPRLIVIAKHDVWPAQIWAAKKKGIPLYLINASLAVKSTRTRRGVKRFLKHVYRDFDAICAISEEDGDRFKKHYPRCRVQVAGDTKYDQVVQRRNAAQRASLIPHSWLKSRWIFVAGSFWPEDARHLFPALKNLLQKNAQFTAVLVPHQPEPAIINAVLAEFENWKCGFFSNRKELSDERLLIVDTVGYLAAIYNVAHAAYVGGSFHQGIHNVMEPAIYGVPVLYGPTHENSYEAIQLADNNGGIVVRDEMQIEKHLLEFLQNEDQRIATGEKAAAYALKNTGATRMLIGQWRGLLEMENK